MTLSEVASFLRVHRNTVYRLARSGKLPGFKTGTDWRFERAAVEAWMRSRDETTAAPEDEVLNIIYWMLSQGLSLSVSVPELATLLDWSPGAVKRGLNGLARQGLVSWTGATAALTLEGSSEAKRRFGRAAKPPSGHDSVRRFAERHARP